MFIIPGVLGAWMGWLVLKALTGGAVTARSVTYRRVEEPLWFWLATSIYAFLFLFLTGAAVLWFWRGVFPRPY
ncbi:hypothetical protein HNP52_001367 [Sphingomonas kyeonggiensis]|uniref:Uncharacterized protein n=1 Tax=Sphingomonas kyeonggiensis TaxID=1268553 RepID=A0A7W7JZL3_9SPHN|nr:hypothetical protein [Sphingomonas kyeonggiensis]MBB4838316.1 hypothetical protein [Sphingomonas kyeonggiensis]